MASKHRWTLTLAFVPFLLLFPIGCDTAETPPERIVERPGKPPIVRVEEEDAEMKAAIEQARSTIEQFFAALATKRPGQTNFADKVPISDGNHVEHMWLMPVTDLGQAIRGTISNEPDQVIGVRIGDVREFAKDEISDWMYIDHGHLVGGYTLRAMYNAATPEERATLEANSPFKFD
jgi:uncharacterized protein YegJ (DUF2314 family)